ARPDPLRPGTAVPDDDHSRSSRAAAVRLPVRLRDGAFYRSRIDRGTPPQIVRIMMRRRHWGMILLGLLHAAQDHAPVTPSHHDPHDLRWGPTVDAGAVERTIP